MASQAPYHPRTQRIDRLIVCHHGGGRHDDDSRPQAGAAPHASAAGHTVQQATFSKTTSAKAHLGPIPLTLLAVFVVMVCVVNYHSGSSRTHERAWNELVAQARSACTDPRYGAVYIYTSGRGRIVPVVAGTPVPDMPPVGFPVRLPCTKLRA
jgi:hypothetical protein